MGARGEGIINVNGREIPILFTNRALLSAEKQLGKGIIGILNGFANGDLGINELVALLRCGMEAARQDARRGGKPVSNENAMDIIEEIGFTGAIAPVMEAVAAVISYTSQAEPDDKGEENPN
jgi:hypothetical protein